MARTGRTLLVAGTLEPNDVTTYAEHLTRGLLGAGSSVELVARGGSLAGRLAESGAGVALFPRLGGRILGVISNARAVARAAAFAPQVVHALSPGAWPAARVFSRSLGPPAVVTYHDFVTKSSPPPWDGRNPPLVIALSEALRENLVNEGGIPKPRVSVVPVGLDLSMFPAGALGPSERKHVVGCIGPLEPRKGGAYFIRAAKRVLGSRDDVEFVLAGKGPAERDLRRLAKEVGVRAALTFAPGDRSAVALLRNFDVFVLPALREALGVGALEAMACRVPVVAFGSGGMFELVRDGETGFLVPPGDEKALAEAILELLARPDLRRDLGRAGRELVEREFSVGRMVKGTLAVYDRAVEEGAWSQDKRDHERNLSEGTL